MDPEMEPSLVTLLATADLNSHLPPRQVQCRQSLVAEQLWEQSLAVLG